MEKNGINYNDLFAHVNNLKKVLLVAGGRTGSDFFQSLLDGHSEILQFTGVWYFHFWWREAKCKENLSDLIDEFIWCTSSSIDTAIHIAKFKSYYNKQERWGQLGPNKDEFFEVSIDAFKNHMLNILADRELNSKNFFLAVNLAYGLAAGTDIERTKIIFYHAHDTETLKEFKEDFQDFDVIYTIREPRNILVSGMDHFKEYDATLYNSGRLYYLLKRIFEELEPILQHTKNVKVLKLEDLHLFSKEVLDEFCGMYGLEFEDCMLESSYRGKKWWGDAVSGKYLDGFNKNIKEKKWKNKLFFYDNLLIEFILEDRLRHYGYPLENKISKIYWIFMPFLVFLPMKYELDIFSYNFRNAADLKGKVASLEKTMRFYILRMYLHYKYLWKKIGKKIFLAEFFQRSRYN